MSYIRTIVLTTEILNLQKFVEPTFQFIIENSRAAPSPKKMGRKR